MQDTQSISITIASHPSGYAVDGTSFAVIKDHYPNILEVVGDIIKEVVSSQKNYNRWQPK